MFLQPTDESPGSLSGPPSPGSATPGFSAPGLPLHAVAAPRLPAATPRRLAHTFRRSISPCHGNVVRQFQFSHSQTLSQIIEAKGLYAIQRFAIQQLRMNVVSQDRVPTTFIRVKARIGAPSELFFLLSLHHSSSPAPPLNLSCAATAPAVAFPLAPRACSVSKHSSCLPQPATPPDTHPTPTRACPTPTPPPTPPQLIRSDGSPSVIQRTPARRNTSTPLFESLFYFDNLHAAEGELASCAVQIAAFDRGRFGPHMLIGTIDLDLEGIYQLPNHELWKTWLTLTDPKGKRDGPQGQVLACITVLGKEDKPADHTMDAARLRVMQ